MNKKLIIEIEINSNLQKVVDTYVDLNSFSKWQNGFQSHQIIHGIYLQKDTKSKIIYKNRNNTIELIETILSNNLPNELEALYEHKHIINIATSKFIQINENRARLEYTVEILELRGFMIKIMSKLFPNMFRKQTKKWLENFKRLVEN